MAKVCQNDRKYLLPKMPTLLTSTIYVGLRITNFLTPHLFYVLYKHSYVDKMLNTIDILANSLKIEKKEPTIAAATTKPKRYDCYSSTMSDADMSSKLGDFVIAPLYVERHNALMGIVKDHNLTIHRKDDQISIMARAEILKVLHYNYKPMVKTR